MKKSIFTILIYSLTHPVKTVVENIFSKLQRSLSKIKLTARGFSRAVIGHVRDELIQ